MQVKVWETVLEVNKVVVVEILSETTTSQTLMDLAILLYRFYQKVNFNC